jgi:GTP cyclohydrolase I
MSNMSETYAAAVEGVRALLIAAGQDPDRPGLIDTPDRLLRALVEATTPTGRPPEELLAVTFSDASPAPDQMITLGPIPFSSMCEHHLLPFWGSAWVAYIPGPTGAVVGLSKLARLVDWYARSLQIQERLTAQVTEAIEKRLDVLGAACAIEATHSCMTTRGARKPGSAMFTSSLTGVFREQPETRAEFLAYVHRG